jgi:hypothetical protein
MKIWQEGNRFWIDAPQFVAQWEGASLVSVISKQDGSEFCRQGTHYPLQLYYVHENTLDADKHQKTEVQVISEWAARVILSGADSERELLVHLDPTNGDLCVTPSGQSARRGVAAIRWNIAFAPETTLILPCVNGLKVDTAHTLPRSKRFPWPFTWNAQLAIAQRNNSSLMVHTEDTRCKFKALDLKRDETGSSTLGFESEQVGPLWDNRSAGGVEWRLNVYTGDWQTPATRYREWLNKTYPLAANRASRPAWVNDISLNIMWAGTNPVLLDRLAKVYPPNNVLIMMASWRTSPFDINYPDYYPTSETRAFMAQANAMGYHVMPYFNFFSCSNDHTLFGSLRDWQERSPYKNEPQGWYWPPDTHDYTRNGYIHPGLAHWRRILIDRARSACLGMGTDIAFIDQTLCTWNTDNGLVENMTTVEGLDRLQAEFAAIQPDLVLAGEGCNEISFQREAFAQAHIHETIHPGGVLTQEHVEISVPICAFLWRGHTSLLGYYHLDAWEKDMALGIEVYRNLGAMPTLGPGHFTTPESDPLSDSRVLKVLEMAKAWRR